MTAAEAMQRVDNDVPIPSDLLMSPAQLATLPPLPSLAKTASLCNAYMLAAKEAGEQRRKRQSYKYRFYKPHSARVAAIVHLALYPRVACQAGHTAEERSTEATR